MFPRCWQTYLLPCPETTSGRRTRAGTANTGLRMICLRLRSRRQAGQCRCSGESQRPARRSQKPVRSKTLSPQSLDPEVALQPPDDGAWRGEVDGRQGTGQRGPLPAAYQQLDLESSQAPTTPSGFFFHDYADLVSQVRRQKRQQAMHPDAPIKPAGGLNLNYRYTVEEDGQVVDMIKAKRAVPSTFQHAVVQQDLDQDLTPPPKDTKNSAGKYLQVDEPDASAYQDILHEREAIGQRLRLKAFVYCVGQNELFNPLWEMDMVDQIEWVPSLSEANIVIHRRPQPGEKQFHYDQFRSEAQQLGIPFISINAPTARELRKSVLPAMDLYLGKAALPAGKSSKPKRRKPIIGNRTTTTKQVNRGLGGDNRS